MTKDELLFCPLGGSGEIGGNKLCDERLLVKPTLSFDVFFFCNRN